MRILMLNYEFPPLGGGGGIASYKLAKGFVHQGYDVDYVTTWFKGLKKFEIVEGIHIHRVKVIGRKDLHTATMVSMLSYPFFAFLKCINLFKKKKYNLINTHFALPTGPVGAVLSKIYHIPNILSLHGGDIYDPSKKNSPHNKWYLRKAVKWVLTNSNILVAQSSNTKANTLKYYQPDKNIAIIPLPYMPFKFKKVSRKELKICKNKRYIISVGRLIKRKDYPTLINALSLIEDENIECLIIGDGPEKENLLKLAKKLHMEKRLHLLGFVSEEKKFQYLDNADVYALSSLHEGFGICLQEAMQVGLPIVTTNNGGQVDFIKENENGFLIPIKHTKLLAEKIKKLIEDKDLTERISKNNKKDIKKFHTKNIIKQYNELITLN